MFYTYNPKDKKNLPTLAWQAVLFAAALWSGIQAPLDFVFNEIPTPRGLAPDIVISALLFLDVLLRAGKKLKMPDNPKWTLIEEEEKTRPYLKPFWLPLDIFTSLPLETIAYFIAAPYAPFVSLLRVGRLLRARDLASLNEFLPKSLRTAVFLCGILLGLHFISCGWMLLNPRTDLDPASYYNISLYWTVTTLTTVGYGDITPQSNMARIFTMGVMLIGVASYGVIIGNFSRMIMLADKYKEEKKEKMTGLHQFLKYYNIPSSLQRQVFSFYNHLLAQNISEQDHRVLNELPQALQNELAIYMKIKLIKNVHILRNAPHLV